MGNITEIAGGKISELSTQEIENNAGNFISNFASKFVKQKGDQQGVTYDNPPGDERKVKNSIKGLAIFRRKSNYSAQPDFGFDWYAGENYETTYTEPFNYESLVLDGVDSLKKEYAPHLKHISLGEFGYINVGSNSGKSGLNINGKPYFVPWFSGFAKDGSGSSKSYELDVFFNIEEPVEGRIDIGSDADEIEIEFTDEGGSSFEISESTPKQFSKNIKITFLDYIAESTCIIITFHKKSEEEKSEEKQWKEDKAAGKKVDSMPTIYITAGELMGMLNVYNNSIEYDLNVRYVKVHFKGWIKVDGYDEKIYLSKRNGTTSLPDYFEDKDIIKRQQKLQKQKAELEAELAEVQSGKTGWFSSSEETLQKKIAEKNEAILKIDTQNKARLKINQELNTYEFNTLETKFSSSFLKTYEQKIKDTFSQTLSHFKIDKEEYLEADFDNMDDDLYLKKNGASWELMEDGIFSDKGDAGYVQNYLEKIYRENNPGYEDTIVFFVPFDIDDLFGKSESIMAGADNVIVGPAIMAKKDWITIPHEVAHSLGLAHSFPDSGSNKIAGFFEDFVKAGHLFKEGKTENVMDYIYGDVLITFWKWQWDRIHKDSDDMKAIDKLKKNETEK
jgi:citrate lyase gamma subunit